MLGRLHSALAAERPGIVYRVSQHRWEQYPRTGNPGKEFRIHYECFEGENQSAPEQAGERRQRIHERNPIVIEILAYGGNLLCAYATLLSRSWWGKHDQ